MINYLIEREHNHQEEAEHRESKELHHSETHHKPLEIKKSLRDFL